MSTTPTHLSIPRLTGFAAAELWHRRLDRTESIFNSKVQPRLCAELVLHPLPRERGASSFQDTRRYANVFHAA